MHGRLKPYQTRKKHKKSGHKQTIAFLIVFKNKRKTYRCNENLLTNFVHEKFIFSFETPPTYRPRCWQSVFKKSHSFSRRSHLGQRADMTYIFNFFSNILGNAHNVKDTIAASFRLYVLDWRSVFNLKLKYAYRLGSTTQVASYFASVFRAIA